MTAKEFLKQYRHMDKMIRRKREQLKDLRMMSESLGGFSEGERVQNSGSHDKIASNVAKIVDLEAEILSDIDKMIEVKRNVMKTIDMVEEADLKEVLYMRYLEFKTWIDIAYEVGCSYQWVHELHGKALKKIADLIEVDSPHVI